MSELPVIVSTIEAPEGRGWSKLNSDAKPAIRKAAVRVAIYSDATLAALVVIQALHPSLSNPRHAGTIETVGFEWHQLRGGMPPFDNA